MRQRTPHNTGAWRRKLRRHVLSSRPVLREHEGNVRVAELRPHDVSVLHSASTKEHVAHKLLTEERSTDYDRRHHQGVRQDATQPIPLPADIVPTAYLLGATVANCPATRASYHCDLACKARHRHGGKAIPSAFGSSGIYAEGLAPVRFRSSTFKADRTRNAEAMIF